MGADLQWAITGWGQTIFGGTIEEGRLVVTTDYRPFDIASHVNDVEVFDSDAILMEPVGLTFSGELGPGEAVGGSEEEKDVDRPPVLCYPP